jgi:RimJ/RimL family protein N-acetyltransferase
VKVPSRPFRARDGREFAVRSAIPADAGRILDLAVRVALEEPERNVPEPGEVALDADAIARAVRRAAQARNSLHLVAESEGALAGWLTLEGGRHRKLRHTAELGMAVARAWRRQGVGRALLASMAEAARAGGELRRVTLQVFATNEPALALYRSFGFSVEGVQRGQVRIGDRFVDRVLMALDLR